MEWRVEGFRELDAKLKALGNEAAGQALLPALRAAGRVIRDEARRRAPVKTGFLRRSIGIRIDRKQVEQGAAVLVRVSRKAYYGRFIELGTDAHEIEPKRSRRRRQLIRRLARRRRSNRRESADIAELATLNLEESAGMGNVMADKEAGEIYGTRVRHPGIRAQPFLRPAIDVKGQEAINVLRDRLRHNIAKLTRR